MSYQNRAWFDIFLWSCILNHQNAWNLASSMRSEADRRTSVFQIPACASARKYFFSSFYARLHFPLHAYPIPSLPLSPFCLSMYPPFISPLLPHPHPFSFRVSPHTSFITFHPPKKKQTPAAESQKKIEVLRSGRSLNLIINGFPW